MVAPIELPRIPESSHPADAAMLLMAAGYVGESLQSHEHRLGTPVFRWLVLCAETMIDATGNTEDARAERRYLRNILEEAEAARRGEDDDG